MQCSKQNFKGQIFSHPLIFAAALNYNISFVFNNE